MKANVQTQKVYLYIVKYTKQNCCVDKIWINPYPTLNKYPSRGYVKIRIYLSLIFRNSLTLVKGIFI